MGGWSQIWIALFHVPLWSYGDVREYNIELEGRDVVVVGASNIVGKPMASLLLNANATVDRFFNKKPTNFSLYKKNLAPPHTLKIAKILVIVGKFWKKTPNFFNYGRNIGKEGAVGLFRFGNYRG